MTGELSRYVIELKRDDAVVAVKTKLKQGEDPLSILDECRQGMTKVGELFQAGDYYLAELMLSAEVFKSAVAVLDPYLAQIRSTKPLGKVVLATPKGDIHDLGKNILGTLLKAHGFEVHDLGVDVLPSTIVERVREIQPDFVGLSALITIAFDSMREAATLFEEDGIRTKFKLMVGGGVTTPGVKDYIGADFQTVDATEGVSYCMRTAGDK
ncbi:MAG: cobalamin-binding protein [Planctomycetes bacterium]|nr:cobalamin-binding protein [Planctomycetota bacterium]